MSRRGRSRFRRIKQRRERALAAQRHLEELLSKPWDYDQECVDSAARDILRLGRRHRLGLPNGRRTWGCRDCQLGLRPGINARVRIRSKILHVTCLTCGRINRQGPNYKGNQNE